MKNHFTNSLQFITRFTENCHNRDLHPQVNSPQLFQEIPYPPQFSLQPLSLPLQPLSLPLQPLQPLPLQPLFLFLFSLFLFLFLFLFR